MNKPSLTHFGRYRVVQELGRGAMGVVYLADDESLQRQVAVKTMQLPDDPAERAELEGRFRQEALAAGGLNHPNIITIHDLGCEGDWLYIAMEFLRGAELRDLMTQGVLTLRQALDIAAQVAAGLAAAHERGVIHRDIKPSNIMVLPDGHAKIMDFGVARMQSSKLRTQTGVMLGSPKYMSPEQVEGSAVDRRTDIFSLGSTLYEMVAGVPAFTGNELGSLLSAITHSQPPAPSTVNREVPSQLDTIIAKAMQKDPAARYQDARTLARELEECATATRGSPSSQGAVAAPYRPEDAYAATMAASAADVVAALPVPVSLPLAASPNLNPAVALRRFALGHAAAAGRALPWRWMPAFAAAALCALWIAFG